MECGSPESIEATDLYFRMLNLCTLKASNKIASKERGKSFVRGSNVLSHPTGEYFGTSVLKRYKFNLKR